MNKTKIWIKRGTVFGLGAALLLASGLSAMAGTSGYETYKSALKHTISAESLTNQGTIVVTDNGKQIFRADLEAKRNKETNGMSASAKFTVTGASESQTMQAFKQGEKAILHEGDSDTYRVMNLGENKREAGSGEFAPPQHAEQFIEALMGNVKDLATVEELPSGVKQASLHLSGSQIPAVVQAAGSLAASHLTAGPKFHGQMGAEGRMAGNDSETAQKDGLAHPSMPKVDFPELTDNVKVEDIQFDAEISPEQYIKHQQGKITISGTDKAGDKHELVISIDCDLSGFGQTTPDTVDLTGKQVETIERNGHTPPWHR
ncbi:hypothetical protein EHV15_23480 [Paenibacillus oralis]|uniref:DUF5666 domain-containing protein n=1 Tax=Paenibacillus oralis TaxID=2490856 RepID=A0A3P3U7J9_9BACL|nr:hypothetical protein [Paenibacillus oralis]RRJ65548.1 hypothetical protein EHV15_23480 [Paenibacillus oralis]